MLFLEVGELSLTADRVAFNSLANMFGVRLLIRCDRGVLGINIILRLGG